MFSTPVGLTKYMYNEEKTSPKLIIGIIAGAIALFLASLFILPAINRYNKILNAQTELNAQQYLRQVAIATAEAKNESAKFEAEAEITRAGGVAQANKIIGESLTNNEAYLRYLFVNNLEHTQNQVIYIPTEAGLPVLEAGKR